MSCFSGPEITNDGLVMCLDATNVKSYPGTGTTWSDINGNNISTTIQNSGNNVSFSTGYAQFSPVDQTSSTGYYLINDSRISSITTQITLECWVNVTSIFSGIGARPISPRITEGGSPIGFSLFNGIISYEINTSNGWVTGSVGNSACTFNTWICVSQTTDDANKLFKTYVNGIQVASLSFTGTPQSGGGILIGRGFYGGTNNFYGKVSNVKYYNIVLTADQVKQNFNATRGRYGI